MKRHWQKILLIAICLIIIVTRFVPISYGDLYGDNAINSFRAYGWFDFLGKSGQSTPYIWLGHIPGWSLLSFHDAPPVAFLIQKIFFTILGGSVVIARLPYVLAGITSILLTYLILRKILNEKVAILSSSIYAICSYSIWAGQAGYLEGIEEMFIIGSILLGGYFLFKENKNKYIYYWAIFSVLAILTKYTAIFLIPPIIMYLFLFRDVVKKHAKHFILVLILVLILMSPLAIYNAKMYSLRGHFDAALSSMVGMHPDDFSIISDRSVSLNIFANIRSFFNTIKDNISYPLFILFIISLIVLIIGFRKKGIKSFENWILVNFMFLILLFSFSPSGDRFLSITVPFIVLITTFGIRNMYIWFDNSQNSKLVTNSVKKTIFYVTVILVLVFELFYAFNTNVLKNPIGTVGWFHSGNKILNLGFNQVDQFIRDNVIDKLPKYNNIKTKEDTIFNDDDVKGRSVVIFDDRINWFAQMWYFQKYFLYYRWPVISTAFLTALNENTITIEDLLEVSQKPLYFIYPINDMVIDKTRENDIKINSFGPELAGRFDKLLSATTTTIYDKNKVPVFKIYKISQ